MVESKSGITTETDTQVDAAVNAEVNTRISAQFERVAVLHEDIAAPVYARYFAADPAASALMAHMDHLTRGRMLNEVLRLLMDWDATSDGAYLDFEVRNHQWAYRVEPGMYGALLTAVRDTVADVLGAEWHADMARDWNARIDLLVREIAARAE